MGPGGFPSLQNHVTLHRRVGWVRFPHSPATALVPTLLCIALVCPQSAQAQQRDSARAGVAAPHDATASTALASDTPRPPMSPRRAFLTSLALPGYAQTVFGRSKAAMLFSLVEIGAIGMARKAAIDLAEAKGMPRDSVSPPTRSIRQPAWR